MLIGGFQKTSLLDFPEKISAIIFTKGCNFRCPYCHNPELLHTQDNSSEIKGGVVLEFLQSRIGKLDGVVITGGEPCLQKDLEQFIIELKKLGFLVKLDTNGSFPDVLESLVRKNLLDYIAMDIKAPLSKYKSIVGSNFDIRKIKKSIDIVMNGKVDYEFRTTVLKSLLSKDDFELIGHEIHGAKRYYLQKFVPSKILDKSLLSGLQNYSDEDFRLICEKLCLHVNFVRVR